MPEKRAKISLRICFFGVNLFLAGNRFGWLHPQSAFGWNALWECITKVKFWEPTPIARAKHLLWNFAGRLSRLSCPPAIKRFEENRFAWHRNRPPNLASALQVPSILSGSLRAFHERPSLISNFSMYLTSLGTFLARTVCHESGHTFSRPVASRIRRGPFRRPSDPEVSGRPSNIFYGWTYLLMKSCMLYYLTEHSLLIRLNTDLR